jgi:hypothetical protein
MRVLIACEFSGVVRRAFRERGHDAWSCDLLPSEDLSQFHLRGDALQYIQPGKVFLHGSTRVFTDWDLIIAHPPCTYLCNSGVRWLKPDGRLNVERHQEMMNACDLFAALYSSKCPRVCIENPIMHSYARDYLQSAWSVPVFTQSIQPWQFGHGEVKRTCLWLRGLPDLKPSNIVAGRTARVHRASPGPDRWKERSRTLSGIAKAMAEQWGSLPV